MDVPAFPTDLHVLPSSGGRATTAAASGGGFHPFGKDGFSFWDLVDIINPLQHIPIISTLYRRITGDALAPLPRIAGGALFGGIAGVVSAVTNLVVNEATGRDIGENVFALLGIGIGHSGKDRENPADVPAEMLASAPSNPTFSVGWQAVMAMQYCDAECLDPKRSLFVDTARLAAARYAEAGGLAPAAGGQRLDMHG
jgi:hypothetical protein